MIKSTVCYLIRDDKWLMMLRNKKQHDLNHGKWIGVGGKLKDKETPFECMVREVVEETGYQVQSAQYCGIIHFHYNCYEDEEIYVYQTNDYIGTLQECNEGTLAYIAQNKILHLELWEGDRIFLEKMFRNEIPFSISLYYDENEVLVKTEVKEANSNE